MRMPAVVSCQPVSLVEQRIRSIELSPFQLHPRQLREHLGAARFRRLVGEGSLQALLGCVEVRVVPEWAQAVFAQLGRTVSRGSSSESVATVRTAFSTCARSEATSTPRCSGA